MSHLGELTDDAFDAIINRVAGIGASKFVGMTAREFILRYGTQQAIYDGERLVAAMWNDNEQLWIGDKLVEKQAKAFIRTFITRLAGIAEEAGKSQKAEGEKT